MSIFFIYNDKIYQENTNIISPDNPGLKYGDGLFETIKVSHNKIQLKDFHFERLFSGMKMLQFDKPKHFTSSYFENKILELCLKNNHSNARLRLMIFRGEENFPNYTIQSFALKDDAELNETGLNIIIYPDAKKSCDTLSNLKSNNYLPFTMAAMYAKNSNADDCIILNSHERICETSIANIFIIKDENFYTPSLTEGCIAGVVRRFIIENLKNFKIIERSISISDLENADELFLTNSIKGIRWVEYYKNFRYSNTLIKKLHKSFIKTIY